MSETLFTVGPVQMFPDSLKVGSEPLPYFRTAEFSAQLLECEAGLLRLFHAPSDSRCAFLTTSGSGAMEAVVTNAFDDRDRLLIVDGGTFGHRFVEIAEAVGVPHDVVTLAPGRNLTAVDLGPFSLADYSALVVNAHETSTGVAYDLEWLGRLCREAGLLFVVDAISAFLCDPIDQERDGIDFLITSSQKALALAPGLSMVALSPRGLARLTTRPPRSYYLNLSRHLDDGRRGQTPFTPAVGVVLQLQARLRTLLSQGDTGFHCGAAASRAQYFRSLLVGLPVERFAERPSNALTSLRVVGERAADEIFHRLKDEYRLVVTPNGGPLAKTVFRVGHMGNLDQPDYDRLVRAMKEVLK